MRRILVVLGGILQALAWLVFGTALALFLVEQAGGFTHLARSAIRKRLGPLADSVEIDHVRLKWFEPALVVERLTVRGETQKREELLRLDSTHLALRGWFDRTPRSIHVRGGGIRLSNELAQTLDRIRARLELIKTREPRVLPPRILANDLELELDLPREPFRMGKIHLEVQAQAQGAVGFRGAFQPTCLGALPPQTWIDLEGHGGPEGTVIRTAADSMPLSSATIQWPPDLGRSPVPSCGGRLSFQASLAIDPRGRDTRGAVRASLRDGSALWREDLPPLEGLALDLEAECHPERIEDFVSPEAWSALGRISGTWNGTPLSAWTLLTPPSATDAFCRIFARAEKLALDESLLRVLGDKESIRRAWEAFAPSGSADASIDLALRRRSGGVGLRRSFALHARGGGTTGIAFEGFQNPQGKRMGIPVPISSLQGHALFTFDEDLERPYRLALVSLQGNHPSGSAQGWAHVTDRDIEPNGELSEIDLAFEVPEMAIDESLRTVLDRSAVTRVICPTYDPRGGTLRTAWRFRQGPETHGITAAGLVTIQGTHLQWSEIPVPLEETSGELRFLWAPRSSVILGEPGQVHRAIGVGYSFSNETLGASASQGTRARIRGFAREESLPEALERSEIPFHLVQGIEVEIPELLLRGRDSDTLADRFPELRIQRVNLGARGHVNVLFRGARPHPEMPWRSEVEVAPGLVEVQPSFFKRNTQDLVGRILVRLEGGSAGQTAETRLDLAARWPDDVDLAAHATIPSRGRALVHVFGAGIDPTNTAFQGALTSVLVQDEPKSPLRVDLSQSRLEGRIDFDVRATFEPGSKAAPEAVYRVFLRENTLKHASLRLDRLHGVLEQSADLLQSPLVVAELAGHPVELRNVLVFPLSASARIGRADPLLLRLGYPADLAGLALQAEFHTRDLPLDEEHLRNLVGEESSARLGKSPEWRGRIDVPGARIVLTGPADREGILLVQGPLLVRDLSLRLGLPITIVSARTQLEEFALEGKRFRGWAHVEDLDARIAGRRLSKASMIVGYVDGRLTIDALSGDFEREGAQGRLTSLGKEGGGQKALGIDLSEPFRFDVALQLQSVPVDRLLRGVFQSSIADEGFLDVDLELAGTPENVLGLQGRGQLHLRQGKLWSIPVMRELFSQLGFDQTASFDELQARFELRDGVLTTPYLEIKSTLLNLLGNGWIDLDGRLRYDLEVRYSLLDRLGFLNRILYWMNRQIWRVAVRGDLSRPRVVIRNSFLELVRGFEDSPPRLLPLPPFTPLPSRF